MPSTVKTAKEISDVIFCGVTPNYQGILTPEGARDTIQDALPHRYDEPLVFPGLMISAEGIVPAGGYIVAGKRETILMDAERLRKKMKQSTLSVSFEAPDGVELGFLAVTTRSLDEAASAWVNAAQGENTFVPCGIVDLGDLRAIIGNAYPTVKDGKKWQKSLFAICRKLKIFPEIRQVDTYILK